MTTDAGTAIRDVRSVAHTAVSGKMQLLTAVESTAACKRLTIWALGRQLDAARELSFLASQRPVHEVVRMKSLVAGTAVNSAGARVRTSAFVDACNPVKYLGRTVLGFPQPA